MTRTQPATRVLVVDDHQLVRTGIQMLFESTPGYALIGAVGTPAEALSAAEREQPDVILLDLDLSGEDSTELIPQLLERAPGARVIILTGERSQDAHLQVIRLGAMGLVMKDKPVEVLLKAINKVKDGEVWFDRALVGSVLSERARSGANDQDPEAAKISSLTPREREIISFVGEGLKNKQIAERAFISETTVRHHLTSIFSKLDVSDRLELIIFAYRHGLAKPPR